MVEKFENPINGYREEAGSGLSWLWCFLFCTIYIVIAGLWKHLFFWVLFVGGAAAIDYFLALIIGFFISLIYAATIRDSLKTKYLRKGWKLVVEEKIETPQAQEPQGKNPWY